MPLDRPVLGITLMLGFCIIAPLSDAIAKLLGGSMPLAQLLFFRFLAQALLLSPMVWWSGGSLWLKGRVFRLSLLRAFLHIAGVAVMFSSLRYLPLADAVAIAFVMPFIMLLLGRMVLKEEIGPRRLIACVAGFVGTLLVIKPSFAEVGLPALLPLGTAIIFALFILVTRMIAKACDPITIQATNGIYVTFGMGIAYLLSIGDPDTVFSMTPLEGTDLYLLIAICFIGTYAHLLMTWSLRFAPAATLAPMQYLEIPVATLLGWLIFSDLPDGLAALGIAITMGSGLYVVHRERANARLVPAET